MNIFWIQEGKMMCIVGMIFTPLVLIVIFTTDNTQVAALMGSLLTILGFIMTKAIPGWTRKRYIDNLRKQRLQNHFN